MSGMEAKVRGASYDLTGGEALVGQLLAEGVRHVFGIPGVQLDWAVEAFRKNREALELIVPRHEQATSYMADGYARTTGREGVCMVVPGPGVLNALSGLATAYACNSPVLMIAGQIPSPAIGQRWGLLHELPDQSSILKGLTKWHGIARDPAEVPELVHEAFRALRSGRPQPVAIELPPDVLQARGVAELKPRAEAHPRVPDAEGLSRAASLLRGAHFPVIVAGGGARAAQANLAMEHLAERLQAPVVMTENGRGLLDDRGTYGVPLLGGRVLFGRADVILVIGSRFLDAEGKPLYRNEDTKFIYLNVEPYDMAGNRQSGITVTGDARLATEALLAAIPRTSRRSIEPVMDAVKRWIRAQSDAIEPQTAYVQALRAAMAHDDVLVSELTQVGYFANFAFAIQAPRAFVTPGYQGTLGYGFNTALGAAVGNPEKRVVSISGDGGFGWGMQELATLARYKLNLTAVVFVDGRYGNVLRIQRRTFGVDFATEVVNPDFQQLAAAYRIPGGIARSPDELRSMLAESKRRGGPSLIAVEVGEMPSPWALIHAFVPPASPPPPDPLAALSNVPPLSDRG